MYTDTGNTCKYVVIAIDLCFVLVRPWYFKTWRHWILGALLQALAHAQSSDFWQPGMVYARQRLKAIHFNPCCVPQSTWKNGTPAYIRYDTIYDWQMGSEMFLRGKEFSPCNFDNKHLVQDIGHAGYAFPFSLEGLNLAKWYVVLVFFIWCSLPVFTHAVSSHCSDINPRMVLESGYLTRRCWLKLRIITKLTKHMFWFKDIAYLPHVEKNITVYMNKYIFIEGYIYIVLYLVIHIYIYIYHIPLIQHVFFLTKFIQKMCVFTLNHKKKTMENPEDLRRLRWSREGSSESCGPKGGEVGEPRGVKKGGPLQKLEGWKGHMWCVFFFLEHSHNKS